MLLAKQQKNEKQIKSNRQKKTLRPILITNFFTGQQGVFIPAYKCANNH